MRLENVCLAYGTAAPVFERLSLDIVRGGHLALLGPNGAGKSSLLRLLQGELKPVQQQDGGYAGRVLWYFDGRADSSALSAREHTRLVSPAMQRAYVRQGWQISGEEILLSGLANAAMVYGELSSRHYRRAAALAESAGAEDLLALNAPAMSQGQLRLMLILRALMSGPALLLLDEPFDGLDGPARAKVLAAMALAAKKGSTLIASAHRQEDVPPMMRAALLLERGQVRRLEGETLRAWPGKDAPARTGSATRPDAEAQAGFPAQIDAPAQSSWAVGKAGQATKNADSDFVQALKSRPSPLLELEHVDVYIDRQQVLFDLDWRVLPGEQWLVSGPNGAGKSTLLRLLYGEEFAAFGGNVRWCGRPRPDLEELRGGVGYVSDRLQDTYDYDLTALEVVISGLDGSIGLYREPEERERALARLWLERLGLAPCADIPFHSLSSGNARKTLLARALAGSPPVLLLDEPVTALDPESRARFLNALPLLADAGVTLIYVSHHAQDISPVFSHELRLEKGRAVYAGKRKRGAVE